MSFVVHPIQTCQTGDGASSSVVVTHSAPGYTEAITQGAADWTQAYPFVSLGFVLTDIKLISPKPARRVRIRRPDHPFERPL
jgi:pyruvate-formate lyase-activating enzyme